MLPILLLLFTFALSVTREECTAQSKCYDQTNDECVVITDCELCPGGEECSQCTLGNCMDGGECTAGTDCIECDCASKQCREDYCWDETHSTCVYFAGCEFCPGGVKCSQCILGKCIAENGTCQIDAKNCIECDCPTKVCRTEYCYYPDEDECVIQQSKGETCLTCNKDGNCLTCQADHCRVGDNCRSDDETKMYNCATCVGYSLGYYCSECDSGFCLNRTRDFCHPIEQGDNSLDNCTMCTVEDGVTTCDECESNYCHVQGEGCKELTSGINYCRRCDSELNCLECKASYCTDQPEPTDEVLCRVAVGQLDFCAVCPNSTCTVCRAGFCLSTNGCVPIAGNGDTMGECQTCSADGRTCETCKPTACKSTLGVCYSKDSVGDCDECEMVESTVVCTKCKSGNCLNEDTAAGTAVCVAAGESRELYLCELCPSEQCSQCLSGNCLNQIDGTCVSEDDTKLLNCVECRVRNEPPENRCTKCTNDTDFCLTEAGECLVPIDGIGDCQFCEDTDEATQKCAICNPGNCLNQSGQCIESELTNCNICVDATTCFECAKDHCITDDGDACISNVTEGLGDCYSCEKIDDADAECTECMTGSCLTSESTCLVEDTPLGNCDTCFVNDENEDKVECANCNADSCKTPANTCVPTKDTDLVGCFLCSDPEPDGDYVCDECGSGFCMEDGQTTCAVFSEFDHCDVCKTDGEECLSCKEEYCITKASDDCLERGERKSQLTHCKNCKINEKNGDTICDECDSDSCMRLDGICVETIEGTPLENCDVCNDGASCTTCRSDYCIGPDSTCIEFGGDNAKYCLECKDDDDDAKCTLCDSSTSCITKDDICVELNGVAPNCKYCNADGENCDECDENFCNEVGMCVDWTMKAEYNGCYKCNGQKCTECDEGYCFNPDGTCHPIDSAATFGDCLECLDGKHCLRCNDGSCLVEDEESDTVECHVISDNANCYKCEAAAEPEDDPTCIECDASFCLDQDSKECKDSSGGCKECKDTDNDGTFKCQKCHDEFCLDEKLHTCLSNSDTTDDCYLCNATDLCTQCLPNFCLDDGKCEETADAECKVCEESLCDECIDNYCLDKLLDCQPVDTDNCSTCGEPSAEPDVLTCEDCKPDYCRDPSGQCVASGGPGCYRCHEKVEGQDVEIVCDVCREDYCFNVDDPTSCILGTSDCLKCKDVSLEFAQCTECDVGFCLGSDNLCHESEDNPQCELCPDSATCSQCREKYCLSDETQQCLQGDENCSLCSESADCLLCNEDYCLDTLVKKCVWRKDPSNPITDQCFICDGGEKCTECFENHCLRKTVATTECISWVAYPEFDECLECPDPFTEGRCSKCSDHHCITPDPNNLCLLPVGYASVCEECMADMQGDYASCQKCKSTHCLSKAYFSGGVSTETLDGACVPGEGLLAYCATCDDAVFCDVCMTGYCLKPNLVCEKIISDIGNCANCNSEANKCLVCAENHCLAGGKCIPWSSQEDLDGCHLCSVKSDEDGEVVYQCDTCEAKFCLTSPAAEGDSYCVADANVRDNCAVCLDGDKCDKCVEGHCQSDDYKCVTTPDPDCKSCPSGVCDVCKTGYCLQDNVCTKMHGTGDACRVCTNYGTVCTECIQPNDLWCRGDLNECHFRSNEDFDDEYCTLCDYDYQTDGYPLYCKKCEDGKCLDKDNRCVDAQDVVGDENCAICNDEENEDMCVQCNASTCMNDEDKCVPPNQGYENCMVCDAIDIDKGIGCNECHDTHCLGSSTNCLLNENKRAMCKVCSGSNMDVCTVCQEGYCLKIDVCISNKSIPNCAVCSSATRCQTCEEGYCRYNNKCLRTEPVDLKCTTCTSVAGVASCTQCAAGYCVDQDGVCRYNEYNCLTCISGQSQEVTECVTCLSDKLKPLCLRDSDKQCIAGVANCRTCSESGETCDECAVGYCLSSPTLCVLNTEFGEGCLKCTDKLKCDGYMDSTCKQPDGKHVFTELENCVECSDKYTCTLCETGYCVHNGKCEASAVDGCTVCEAFLDPVVRITCPNESNCYNETLGDCTGTDSFTTNCKKCAAGQCYETSSKTCVQYVDQDESECLLCSDDECGLDSACVKSECVSYRCDDDEEYNVQKKLCEKKCHTCPFCYDTLLDVCQDENEFNNKCVDIDTYCEEGKCYQIGAACIDIASATKCERCAEGECYDLMHDRCSEGRLPISWCAQCGENCYHLGAEKCVIDQLHCVDCGVDKCLDITTDTCIEGPTRCGVCDGASTCLECDAGLCLEGGACVDKDLENCVVCDGDVCDECREQYCRFADDTCVRSDVPHCKRCPEVTWSQSGCEECHVGYCLDVTEKGDETIVCRKNPDDNAECVSCDGETCLQCSATHCLYEGKCYEFGAGRGECLLCDAQNENNISCLVCADGCVTETGGCKDNTVDNCARCTDGDASDCKECLAGYCLFDDDVNDPVCLETDIDNCVTCPDGTQCSKCQPGMCYNEDTGECEATDFTDCVLCAGDAPSHECNQCDDDKCVLGGACVDTSAEDCAVCVGSADKCLECNVGYCFNTFGECVKGTPDENCEMCGGANCLKCFSEDREEGRGQYCLQDNGATCARTGIAFCKECKQGDVTTCVECDEGFIFDDKNECLDARDLHQDPTGKTTLAALENCELGTYDLAKGRWCKECAGGFVWTENGCVTNDPGVTFCQTFSTTENKCLECVAGLYRWTETGCVAYSLGDGNCDTYSPTLPICVLCSPSYLMNYDGTCKSDSEQLIKDCSLYETNVENSRKEFEKCYKCRTDGGNFCLVEGGIKCQAEVDSTGCGCVSCDGSNVCLTCSESCPNQFDGWCFPSDERSPNCEVYDDTKQECTSCKAGFTLEDNVCKRPCPYDCMQCKNGTTPGTVECNEEPRSCFTYNGYLQKWIIKDQEEVKDFVIIVEYNAVKRNYEPCLPKNRSLFLDYNCRTYCDKSELLDADAEAKCSGCKECRKGYKLEKVDKYGFKYNNCVPDK